jgi:hypothetical protein
LGGTAWLGRTVAEHTAARGHGPGHGAGPTDDEERELLAAAGEGR